MLSLRARLLAHSLAAVLIAVFFLQSFFTSRMKSASSDEPPHIAAGLANVENDSFNPNTQHPPLMKELAAISLLASGIRLPENLDAERMLAEPPRVALEWQVGSSVIAANGPSRVMLRARFPLIVVSTLLAALLYVWANQAFGTAAALAALFLFTLDPILLAHSAFVTTDMGLAAFSTLFFFCLWHYLRHPTAARLILSGLAMGLMLCAKFSGVFMVPVAALLMIASESRGLRGVPPGRAVIRRLQEFAFAFLSMCFLAACVTMAVYRSFNGVSMYWRGLNNVYGDATPGYLFYFDGGFDSRFPGYFAAAWLLKEPIVTIVMALTGAVVLLRSRAMPWPRKLFFLLPPVAFFLAATIWAAEIGVRYIIPALPFTCLLGGLGLALLFGHSRWTRAAAVLFCVWMIVADAAIYPDQLSYFNEAACLLKSPSQTGLDGGTRCGPLWLDDSNVDWGQGMVQLKRWLTAHPDPRTPWLSTFMRFPPPNAYGLRFQDPSLGEFDRKAMPGLYIVSAHIVARYRNSWLAATEPTAIVGHSLYVYDIR